eukprot:10589380-Alexandrium_andersonii.AAC.1
MRDLGSHLSLGQRNFSGTLSARLMKAGKIADYARTLPAPRDGKLRLALAKLLPMALYGVS